MLNAAALLRSAIAAAFEERGLPFHPSRLTLGALAPRRVLRRAGGGNPARGPCWSAPPVDGELQPRGGLLELHLRAHSAGNPAPPVLRGPSPRPVRPGLDGGGPLLPAPLCLRPPDASRPQAGPGTAPVPLPAALLFGGLAELPRLQQKAPACAADFSQSAASLCPSLLEAASRAFCALQAGGQVF